MEGGMYGAVPVGIDILVAIGNWFVISLLLATPRPAFTHLVKNWRYLPDLQVGS